MNIEKIELLVEEPSMEAALNNLLPGLLGDIPFEIFSFRSKDDLLSKLPSRLRGYARYLPNTWRIIILIDRDNQDCMALKQRLENAAADANLPTRTSSESGSYSVANRIVIEELEAWYFGDWEAVMKAYPKIDGKWPRKAGFRDPDTISGGTWEAFERIAQEAGYFEGGLRKVEAANKIAPLLTPALNTSRSFQAFWEVIRELVNDAEPLVPTD